MHQWISSTILIILKECCNVITGASPHVQCTIVMVMMSLCITPHHIASYCGCLHTCKYYSLTVTAQGLGVTYSLQKTNILKSFAQLFYSKLYPGLPVGYSLPTQHHCRQGTGKLLIQQDICTHNFLFPVYASVSTAMLLIVESVPCPWGVVVLHQCAKPPTPQGTDITIILLPWQRHCRT